MCTNDYRLVKLFILGLQVFCKSKYFQALNAYITVKCIYNDLKCNNGQDKQQILLQSMKKKFIQ